MPWPGIDKVRSWVVRRKSLLTGLVGVAAESGASLVELGVGIAGAGIPVKLVGELLKYGVKRLSEAEVDLPGLKPAGQVFTAEQFDQINDWLAKLTGAYAGLLDQLEAQNTATANESTEQIIALVRRSLDENAQLRRQFDTALREINGLKLTLVSIKRTVEETHENVLDLRAEMQRLIGLSAAGADEARRLMEAVLNQLAQLGMPSGALRARDSLSIRGEDERALVKALLARFRGLPTDRQKELPALLNGLGKLQVGAGEFSAAREIFVEVATTTDSPAARAEASYNAYRAALEERRWDVALAAILTAAKLDGSRFAPFPLHGYHPIRILGAGGFGTAFLCRDDHFGEEVVVKSLHGGELDRGLKDVFREAQMLRQLDHPGIITVRNCEYTDPINRLRPYIVMDYFQGTTLEEFVLQRGPLSVGDLATVGLAIASAMQGAHNRGILHRDLKPGNILVRKESVRWLVKVIDFGLAMRRQDVETSIAISSRGKTILSESAVGTLDYAPPEQMGKLPGVRPGPYSDVYAFGKTCCYALFKLTEPKSRHWSNIPRELADLLERCTETELEHRYSDFAPVLKGLMTLKPVRQKKAPVPGPQPTQFAPLKEIINSLGMKFAWIPPCPDGFLMGSPPDEKGRSDDETQHRVVLTRGYYLGVHPVTRGQFARFVNDTGYRTEAETSGGAYGHSGSGWDPNPAINWRTPGFEQTDEHPVVCVSWNDAALMCDWLTQQDGQGRRYRLPSEAEWEYACRAGTTTAYFFGNNESRIGDYAWFFGNFNNQTQSVHSKKPNLWGLYHMSGNVWEWCFDVYGPYDVSDGIPDPINEDNKDNSRRVVRGGSWYDNASYCRAARRAWHLPGYRRNLLGFRPCFRPD
jgi:formylglycine-generating enzyme required for sulfatase activity